MDSNIKQMTFAEAEVAASAYIAADIPLYLAGAPGVGKSALARKIADRDFDGNLWDNRASQLDPVDVRGLPFVNNGVAEWARPDLFPAADDTRPGLLLWDELSNAAMAVQSALYQVILDRRIGKHVIPRNYKMLAAGNRVADRAAAGKLSSALANRFAHIEVVPDLDTWKAWAMHRTGQDAIHPVIIAFLNMRPELLHVMPGAEVKGGKHQARTWTMDKDATAFPTPRSWEAVARLMHHADVQTLATGLVGAATAGELSGFIKMAVQIPRIEQILSAPKTTPVPEDIAALYAIATALAYYADRNNFPAILDYVKRMPKEFQVLAVSESVKKDPDLVYSPGYAAWAVENQGIAA